MLGSSVDIQRPIEHGFLMLVAMIGEVVYMLLVTTLWHSDDWELSNMWFSS